MSKLAELASKDWLKPHELKRFGKRVTLFHPASIHKSGEPWPRTIDRIQHEVQEATEANPGEHYTAIHAETDWDRIIGWARGWHLFNRTGDYAFIKHDCSLCAYHKDCSIRGDMVTWCAEFSL